MRDSGIPPVDNSRLINNIVSMQNRIDANTTLTGLFGNPIAHSLSPLFMNYALERLKINCRYIAFNITEGNLKNAIQATRVLSFRGVNLTIPHKLAALTAVDAADPRAEQIGAVNCIVNEGGILSGYNTDYLGFLKPLEDRNITIGGKKALLIGCGGAARAVVYALIHSGIDEVHVANRTEQNAETFISWCRKKLRFKNITYKGDGRSINPELFNSYGIIINATPVGMHPGIDESPLGKGIKFNREQIVYDLIYNPRETELLRRARRDGAQTINGFEMLIVQGLHSLSLWFPDRTEQAFSLEGSIMDFTKKGGRL